MFEDICIAVDTISYDFAQRISYGSYFHSNNPHVIPYIYPTASMPIIEPYTEYTRLYSNRPLSARDYVTCA